MKLTHAEREGGRRNKKKISPQAVTVMKKMRASGESIKSIAERYGVHKETVNRYMGTAKRETFKNRKPSQKVGYELAAILWPKAKALRAEGKSQSEIGREIGVSQHTVGRWLRMDEPPGRPANLRQPIEPRVVVRETPEQYRPFPMATTVTGRLLGDPPPGRSALDMKFAAELARGG